MAYQLKAKESVETNIKRIVLEQLEKAIVQLSNQTPESRGEAVHDARKRFKKIRSVLRLVQDELGKKVYKQENSCYRDAGRHLSEVRDAQVRLETLDSLIKHFSDTVADDAFSNVRSALDSYYQSTAQYVMTEGDAIAQVLPILQEAHERIADWQISNNDWSALEGNFVEGYELGTKAMTKAIAHPTPEHLHEWRKRVKDLWYHSCLLRPLWPELMGEWADQTHQLADYLGDDHDLAVLRQFLLSQPERLKGQLEEIDTLIALLDRRQTQLQFAAQQLGKRLYAESPKALAKRIGRYWEVWQSEQQMPLSVKV